jgi:hypothetical protein
MSDFVVVGSWPYYGFLLREGILFWSAWIVVVTLLIGVITALPMAIFLGLRSLWRRCRS